MKFFKEGCQLRRAAVQKNGCYEVSFGNEHAWCQQLHQKVTFGPKEIPSGDTYIYIKHTSWIMWMHYLPLKLCNYK